MAATIFVVDAHDRVRTTLRQWLEVEFPLYHFIELFSVEGALARTFYQVPNLIIIDMGYSLKRGIEAVRKLKAHRQEVPIVVLTFIDEDDYRAEAMEAGAVAIIGTRKMHEELIPLLTKLLSKVQA